MCERQQRGISGWTPATLQTEPDFKNSPDDSEFGPGGAPCLLSIDPVFKRFAAGKLFGFERLAHSCKRNAEGRQLQLKGAQVEKKKPHIILRRMFQIVFPA